MLHAGSLLSAFTPVPNPSRLCVVHPRCLPSSAAKSPGAPSHAPDGAASGPAVRAVAAPQRAGAAASSAFASAHGLVSGLVSGSASFSTRLRASEEDVWHEKMRLAQEVLTLLRRILTDNVLGEPSSLSGNSAWSLIQLISCMCCMAVPTVYDVYHPKRILNSSKVAQRQIQTEPKVETLVLSLQMCCEMLTAGRAGIEDLVSSSASIRLSLVTSTRLSHWCHSDWPMSMLSGSLPLPLQQWVTAWGSSSSSSTKIINSHPDCRGGLICSSVEDLVYMAKSIRQRVLVQLNHMAN